MDKSTADNQALHDVIGEAVAALAAIGPKPIGKLGVIVRHAHPDAEAWEEAVSAVGRAFFLAVYQAAKDGSAIAQGYVEGFVYPATDASVTDYAATKINARWAEAIRAML